MEIKFLSQNLHIKKRKSMKFKENYQQYVSRYASEVADLKRKNTGFITGELLAFGGILAFLICYFAMDGDTQNYLMGAALCLIA